VVLDAGRIALDAPLQELWSDPAQAARLGIRVPRIFELTAALRARGLDPGPLPATTEARIESLSSVLARALERPG
jgi:CubicO group peptidase (beta-lactamase class C family)